MLGQLQPLKVLWFPTLLLLDLARQANHHAPRETGGVLLGYVATDNAVVTDALGPGPGARHRRFRFVPDTDYQEAEIARRYEASGRLHIYLGDWHSHPRGRSALSLLDRHTLRRIADAPHARIPSPIMLVLARGDPWLPAAWSWHPPGAAPKPRLRPLPIEYY